MLLKKKSVSLVILGWIGLSLIGCNREQNINSQVVTLKPEVNEQVIVSSNEDKLQVVTLSFEDCKQGKNVSDEGHEQVVTVSISNGRQAFKSSKTNQKVESKNKKETKVNNNLKKIGKTISISIGCHTILAHKDDFNKDKIERLPEDGVILEKEDIAYKDGETVFDALVKATKAHKIHMEYTGSKEYKTNYIEGIHNIYEFDCGPLSGWMYKVNGTFPNYGCSSYKLKEGDVVEWVYTCDLGKDVGAEAITQSGEGK